MDRLLKKDTVLVIVFGGGIFFVILTVVMVGILLSKIPQVKGMVMATIMVIPPNSQSFETDLVITPIMPNLEPVRSSPTPMAETLQTPEPVESAALRDTLSVLQDKLSLSTATSTPSPTPTITLIAVPPTPISQLVEGLRIGNMAPDFMLGSNRASRVSLSDFRGKIVILNFWTTWCPACRHEVPNLQLIHNEYGPRNVVVLAVNLGEKLETVERFAQNNGISFAVWLDEDRWAGNIYGIRSIPTTYFIDENGIIRDVNIGTMTREQIIARLEKLF